MTDLVQTEASFAKPARRTPADFAFIRLKLEGAVARLTLQPQSQLRPDAGETVYFDVTRHSTPDSTPIGSINRARAFGDAASREARLRANSSPQSGIAPEVHTAAPVSEQITAGKGIE